MSSQIKQPFQYEKIDIEHVTIQKSKRAENTAGTIKRLAKYLLAEKGKLFLVILMVLMSSGLGLLGPYLVGQAIDTFIVDKQTAGLLFVLAWLLIIYLLHSAAIFLQNFWMIGVAQSTVYTLRKQLFEHFHALPITFFDKRQQGELMSRVTNDIDNINNTLNQSIIQIFVSVITLVGTVTVMLILSPLLTVITMSFIPFMFLAMRWITNRTGPLFKVQQDDLGAMNGYVEEKIG